MVKKLFDISIIRHPKKVLLLLFLGVAFLSYFATKLEIDASSETLLLDTDKDLKFYRKINKLYHNPDFLIVTYSPKTSLLSDKSLTLLKTLTKEFKTIKSVESTTSILNVPLLQSPIQEISELIDGVKTLETNKVDKKLVKKEFLESEIYKNNLVSNDFKTTAILLNLKPDIKYMRLLEKRNSLLVKKRANSITKDEKKLLKKTIVEFKNYRDKSKEENHKEITRIRNILEKHKNEAKLFLGGVNMVADDVIGFVKSDLVIYGSTLVILLIVILWIIFRQVIWILLPLLICILSVISTTGVLGLFGWEVTVISSNFIALQLIITISIVLHLIVRYKELDDNFKHASQYKLVINTLLSKLSPSFFAIITTIAGFGSLVLSGIAPVKNLGWMMSAGIAISLVISFIVFPSIIIQLKKAQSTKKSKFKLSLIKTSISLVKERGLYIIIGSILIIIFSLTGASKLIVENSFINYFKKSTEIYKGMKVIDEKLGGTTPIDVILNFDTNTIKIQANEKKDAEDDFDSFEDEFEQDANDPKYWFTETKMNAIMRVHNYLESLPQMGKVQSLATILKVGKILNKGKSLDAISLGLLYTKLPNKYKNLILNPYINIKENQARITARIVDSNPKLRRNELIKEINKQLPSIINNKTIKFRLSNLMILYNNMLQSLFDSQIKTLGFVIIILFFMFLILFRSALVAFIAILANIVPISIIFGIMGWLHIPLDIMTITIAAISIGIGVDDTIHYIHRFYEEFKKDHNYVKAMERSHESIGYAMTYTSLVIIIGFSILVLSNLVPTVYFGLLTVIVMATMLASALLLLPKLLITFKPYKKESK